MYTTAHLLLSTAPTEVIAQNNAMKVDQMNINVNEPHTLRLLSVPWVPDPYRKKKNNQNQNHNQNQNQAQDRVLVQYASKQALGVKHPLKVRNNTVMIPKSKSTPDLIRIPPTKPIANKRNAINGHVDDVNSHIVPYSRELNIKPQQADELVAALEDQLLQTRWL